MEHLSLPRGAKIDDSERAFCIADPYDGGPFLSFPQRSRFSDLYQKLTEQGWPSTSWHPSKTERLDLDVFLQTWLFFGLLHEIFGVRAPANKFVDERFFITTTKLGEIANDWISEHQTLKDDDGGLGVHLKACLTQAWYTSLSVYRTTKVYMSILRSIAALCETLEDVVLGTLSSGPRTTNSTWGWFHDVKQIERTMVTNGWCPVDASKWRAAANTFQGNYYLSKMELTSTKDHGACLGAVCISNQLAECNGTSRHASNCQFGCSELGVDEAKLMAILADGEVAILDITFCLETPDLIIDVVPANKERKYIAISHVWADGLGNLYGNQLPRCQIIRIARMVQDLVNTVFPKDGKLYLWLDTLCCPVNSQYHRAQCLILMRQIYHDAAHVLVLDVHLNEYDSREIDSIEICARLLFSTWSTRLWTLQEGALARRGCLWIQLRDRAINTENLNAELIRRYRADLLDGHLTLVLSSSLARLRRFIDAGNTSYSAANLVDLRMAVKTRSVSVPTDEPLCLATCMGIDQTHIVQAAPEDRMKEFWISMRNSEQEIPSNAIFFYGERLKTPGLRWAPVSFLAKVAFSKLWLPRSVEEVGVMTDNGLRALFPACEIVVTLSNEPEWDKLLVGLESEIPIRHSRSRWYRIALGCSVPGPWTSISTMEVFQRNAGQNVILTEPALDSLSFTHDGSDLAKAVSGSIRSTTSEGICYAVDQTVTVGLMTEQDAYVHERAWQIVQKSLDLRDRNIPCFRDPVELSILPGHQQLCRLSNAALSEILAVAESASKEDPALEHCLESTRSYHKERHYFAECILRFMGGWFGQVEQTWPRSQQWFVD